MSFSDIAKQVIEASFGQGPGNKQDKITYTVDVGLQDKARDATTAKATFEFSKPISLDMLNSKSPTMLSALMKSYDVQSDMDNISALFAKILGSDKALKSVGKKRTTGSVRVFLGDPANTAPQDNAAVRTITGRFASNLNMRSALELLAKHYLAMEMQKGSAHLKWRTGRFANSLKIKTLGVINTSGVDSVNPQANISYNYMRRPYAVFDPAVSTYHKLSLKPFSGARNPQRLIGEAIAKAARDLLYSKYEVTVREGT